MSIHKPFAFSKWVYPTATLMGVGMFYWTKNYTSIFKPKLIQVFEYCVDEIEDGLVYMRMIDQEEPDEECQGTFPVQLLEAIDHDRGAMMLLEIFDDGRIKFSPMNLVITDTAQQVFELLDEFSTLT